VNSLLSNTELEVAEIDAASGIAFDSDLVNR
jgi:hypothetical protein